MAGRNTGHITSMAADNATIIVAKENGMLGKRMDLLSDDGSRLGILTLPDNPKPLASQFGHPVSGYPNSAQLDCEEAQYRIDFDNVYDSNGRKLGTRFVLRSFESAEILAEARREVSTRFLRSVKVVMTEPVNGQFVSRWKWFRGYWDFLTPSGQQQGYVCEPSALTIRRELRGFLPNMSRPHQAFCIYVFCFCNYMGSSSVPK